MRRIFPVLLLLILLCSCGAFEKVYVWTRNEPAVGRRSPTTYVVRLNVDERGKKVAWLEHVYDDEGPIGDNIYNYKDCEVFDKENWSCTLLTGKNDIALRDGELAQIYWTERRRFESKWVLNKQYRF